MIPTMSNQAKLNCSWTVLWVTKFAGVFMKHRKTFVSEGTSFKRSESIIRSQMFPSQLVMLNFNFFFIELHNYRKISLYKCYLHKCKQCLRVQDVANTTFGNWLHLSHSFHVRTTWYDLGHVLLQPCCIWARVQDSLVMPCVNTIAW